MKTDNKNYGILIFLGVCASMIAITIIQLFFFSGEKDLAIRTSVINIILGAGGMGALLYIGSRILKKLNVLEEMVQPFEDKNFSALAAPGTQSETAWTQEANLYEGLAKAVRNLGIFAEAFRVHAGTVAKMEELIKSDSDNTAHHCENRLVLDEKIREIGDAAGQALCALEELEKYFSSFNELSREHFNVVEEAETRLAKTAELSQSIANTLEESGKVSVELQGKISAGDEESKNANDIIKNTSKELEKITGMAELINEISEKTNILSMNAAIESAHAGAAGAGFAVIADEIRKLADSTKENAGDIQTVLKTIIYQITEALKASDKSSATFGRISAEMAAFTGAMENAARSARSNSNDWCEIKTVLTGSGGRTGKISDSSMDIEVIKNNFHSALQSIKNISAAARDDIQQNAADLVQCRGTHRKTMDKIMDYLHETEELEGMFFSTGPSTEIRSPLVNYETGQQIKNEVAAKAETPKTESSFNLRFTKDPKLETAPIALKPDSPVTVKPPKPDSSVAVEIRELPSEKKTEEINNSWRKDVDVKVPPRTIM